MNDDDALIAELREAVRAERDVPAAFIAAGQAAFAWRTVDAELATLTHDAHTLAGTRTEAANVRALTFVASALTIEVEVLPDAIVGQLVPPQPGRIELQVRDGAMRGTAADDVGWFTIDRAPAGLFRIRATLTDGTSVITPWVPR